MTVDTHMTVLFDAKTEREDAEDFRKHNKDFTKQESYGFIIFDKHLITFSDYKEFKKI